MKLLAESEKYKKKKDEGDSSDNKDKDKEKKDEKKAPIKENYGIKLLNGLRKLNGKKALSTEKDEANKDESDEKDLSPAELSTKLGLKFDNMGNVEGLDIPDEYKITAEDKDDVKYKKQAEQIYNYKKWKRAEENKPKSDNIVPTANNSTDKAKEAPESKPQPINKTLKPVLTSDADKLAGSVQNSSMIDAIRSLDNHGELNTIISILGSIAKRFGDGLSTAEKAMLVKIENMSKGGSSAEGGESTSGGSTTFAIPAGGGSDTAKQGISGSNSYQSSHAKNYAIASGQGYKGQ